MALLGCGTVGSEVYRLLTQQSDALAARIGARLEVAGVAVRRPGRARAVQIGVVGQLPNFNRFLKEHNVDFEPHTAGRIWLTSMRS